jgi:hypothetical protein
MLVASRWVLGKPIGMRQQWPSSATAVHEHATRKRTGAEGRSVIDRIIKARLGSRKVSSITFADVDNRYRK